MKPDLNEATARIRGLNVESLTPSDCARCLQSLVTALREASFYSSRHRPLSVLRLQRFVDELKRDAGLRLKVQSILFHTLRSFDFLSLLTQTGLSRPHGFFQELVGRCFDKFLPRHTARPNFKALLFYLFPSASDARFFMSMPAPLLQELLVLFDPKLASAEAGRAFLSEAFHEQILDALLVLSAESLVLSESPDLGDIRWSLSASPKKSSSFLELNHFVHKVIRRLRHQEETWEVDFAKLEARFLEGVALCRKDLIEILTHLEEGSLSVDLVYQLEVSHLLLERIQALFFIAVFPRSEVASTRAIDFFATLIEEEQRRRSVQTLISQNLHYLARKIVDRAGETGDHYIARSSEESTNLFKAALGGGFLTAFNTLFKILIHHLSLALFFEGVAGTINYGGGFILMQFMHLTLATKQPAMTAAALSGKMTNPEADLSELRTEMKCLLRSQALAAAGNICAVIPTAYCIYLVWQLVFAKAYMSPEDALRLINAHNPVRSLTVFYALLTGVLLWSTSIIHGWVENWMVFRGVAEMLAESFLVENFLSRERRIRLGKWLKQNLAGIVTNFSLGLMLAFTPIFGSFFGLPLEVRHITLSTGSLTLAYASLPADEITAGMLVLSALGLAIILLCNILTSFTLSLWLALRARGWRWHDVRETLRSLARG